MSSQQSAARFLLEFGLVGSPDQLVLTERTLDWHWIDSQQWLQSEATLIEIARSIEVGALGEISSLDEVRFTLVLCTLETLWQERPFNGFLPAD